MLLPYAVVAMLCAFVIADAARAKGLTVVPARYTWKQVKPGSRAEMRKGVTITNISGQKRSYILTARSCASAGTAPSDGFEDIPDVSWVDFERRYVTIDPNSRAQVGVFLNIPTGPQYDGRKWQFYIEVREHVLQYGYLQGRPDLFGLAIFVKARVSTLGMTGLAQDAGDGSELGPASIGGSVPADSDKLATGRSLGRRLYRGMLSELGRLAESGTRDWFIVWNMICLDVKGLSDITTCAGMGDTPRQVASSNGGACRDS